MSQQCLSPHKCVAPCSYLLALFTEEYQGGSVHSVDFVNNRERESKKLTAPCHVGSTRHPDTPVVNHELGFGPPKSKPAQPILPNLVAVIQIQSTSGLSKATTGGDGGEHLHGVAVAPHQAAPVRAGAAPPPPHALRPRLRLRWRRRRARPRPLRAFPDRQPPRRGRPHRALQLPLRALQGRQVRAPRRGHRPPALHQGVRGRRPQRPLLARPRLGRRSGRWRRIWPLPPVGAQFTIQTACREVDGV